MNGGTWQSRGSLLHFLPVRECNTDDRISASQYNNLCASDGKVGQEGLIRPGDSGHFVRRGHFSFHLSLENTSGEEGREGCLCLCASVLEEAVREGLEAGETNDGSEGLGEWVIMIGRG